MSVEGCRWFCVGALTSKREWWIAPRRADGFPIGPESFGFIAQGRLDLVPFSVRAQKINTGERMGDFLWAGGHGLKLVSDRFISALRSVNATGYRTFSIDLFDRAGVKVAGYQGLAVLEGIEGASVQSFNNAPGHFQFAVTNEIVGAIRRFGATSLHIEPLEEEFLDNLI